MGKEMSYTQKSITLMQAKALAGFRNTRKFLIHLKEMPPQRLDKLMIQLHFEEFEKINCLECAGSPDKDGGLQFY
jgi:hypothetical protein